MSPYRRERETAPDGPIVSEPVKDAVARMVQQFADPLAFYRELVQNSIDAGATRVDVHVRFDRGPDDRGTMRIAVADDGCGMTQEIVETALLVLFRSTKEGDPTKIGKFGVGFFSVFAIAPEIVTVETGTGTSDGLLVTLRPDFTWELATAPRRKGTVVSLRVPMSALDAEAFGDRSYRALARWCPHVAVSLTLNVFEPSGTAREARIDSPFEKGDDDALYATDRSGGRYSIRVASSSGTRFFNRGILLHETSNAIVPGTLARVEHPRLGHTISRDDVRRDEIYDQVVARVEKLGGRQLEAHTREAIAGAAGRVASGPRIGVEAAGLRTALATLVLAAIAYGLELADLTWPLLAPVASKAGRSGTIRVSRAPRGNLVYAPTNSSLTSALAAADVPVIDVGDGSGLLHASLLTAVQIAFGGRVAAAETAWGLVQPVAPNDAEGTLLATLEPLLRAVGIPRVALADLVGAAADQIFVALTELPAEPTLLTVEDLARSPFALLDAHPIVLSRRRRGVSAAIEAAAYEPRTAAFLLARLVLLASDSLDPDRDAALARAAAERA